MLVYTKNDNPKIAVAIDQDDFPLNPREDFDNLFRFIFYNRYGTYEDYKKNMPELSNFEDHKDIKKYIEENFNVYHIVPIYIYDHSLQTIKIGSFNGYLPQGHAEFDSYQFGFAFVTKEDVYNEFTTDYKQKNNLSEEDVKEKVIGILNNEVELYNNYLHGEIFLFKKVSYQKCLKCGHTDLEFVDGCSGYFGTDGIEQIKEENGIDDENWTEHDIDGYGDKDYNIIDIIEEELKKE